MKKLLLTLAFAALTQVGMAIPAKNVTRTVRLVDGTEQTVQLRGDETFHFYSTADGRVVRQTEDGSWEWDLRDVTTLWTQKHAARNEHRIVRAAKMRAMAKAMRQAPRHADEVVKKKGLLILVNFKDKKMVNGDLSKTIFNQMLNGLDDPYGKNYGSVREFFRAQSYGQFDIEFDVVGPVTVSQNMSYYGKDEGGEGNDAKPGYMVAEACNLVNSQVNFADYDWDGDGEVENIYITYAGYGQASGASSNTIWPHQWSLSEAYGQTLKMDGVTIDTYACGSELEGYTGSTLDGIGTMCHEYSHCLGLPDFYDTSTNGSNFGMGTWSLMDYGCYNGDGYHPCGYTAYERWFSGWLEPTELKEGCTISEMKNIEENAEAYVIYNDKNHNEYYLLANHQQIGWDKAAYGHGMMVLHVDYDQSAWEQNTLNNTASRQRMTLIPADGKLQLRSGNKMAETQLAGDLFPGVKNNNSLTDTSSPAANLYRANTDGNKLMHKPIEDILEVSGTISFSFMGGKTLIAAPEFTSLVADDTTGFTATWTPVENAVAYNLLYTEKATETQPTEGEDAIAKAIVMDETFEKCVSRGETEITTKLDEYTDNPGWTGEKVFTSEYGAKLGTGKATGQLTTPLLQAKGSTISVWMLAYNYNADTSRLNVTLLTADNKEVETQTVNASDETSVFVTFNNVPSSYKLKFATLAVKKRVIMGSVVVLDGLFEVEALDNYLLEDPEGYDDDDDFFGDFDWDDFDWSEFLSVYEAPRKHVARRIKAEAGAVAEDNAQLIKDITATTYTVADLTPGSTYICHVQAVDAEGNVSAWSEAQSITLGGGEYDATSIQQVRSNTPAVFYDLNGRRMTGILKPGIYISGGRKVFVR